MKRANIRRWLAGAAVTLALIGIGVPATARVAADEPLGVFLPDITVAAATAGREVMPILFVEGEQTLNDLTVSLNYSALAGKVTITVASSAFLDCTTASTTITCAAQFPITIDNGVSGFIRLTVAPTAAAVVGDTGPVTMTASATGFTHAANTSQVTIGEGVDLAAVPEFQEVSTAPGSPVGVPLSVRNVGEEPVNGVTLIAFVDFALTSPVKHGNCRYDGETLRSCEFDATLAPGTAYTLSSPFQVKVRSDVQAPSTWGFETSWLTPADAAEIRSVLDRLGVSAGTPGTGPELDLVEATDAQAPPQTDTEPLNNSTFTLIRATGNQQSDLAAVGDTAAGAVGADVEVEVGAKNLGPVILSTGRAGEPITVVFVSIPDGVSAVGVSERCFPDGGPSGEPGHRDYTCEVSGILSPGESALFAFTLRIDRAVSNATGQVRLNDDPEKGPAYPKDINPANNAASLVINPTTPPGGSLPVTGARTGLYGGIGGALLLLGAAGYLMARRRRVRFVADE